MSMRRFWLALALVVGVSASGTAGEVTLTVVNVVTPQDVKIWEPTSVVARASPESDLGRQVYGANCAICHGEQGDGRGHAAHHFGTAPRDFTAGRYKIRSTASGQLPTNEDLRRSIVRGLPGTGMVPQDHLSEAEVDAVIAFIKN